jgi:hypothetical protein
MPLFQYFGWVGSLLLAALLAANWWFPVPTAPTPASDVPLNQKINIRIHTDHRWPDRVVFDTTRSPLELEAKVGPEAEVGPNQQDCCPGGTPTFRRVRSDGGFLRQTVFSTVLFRWSGCGKARQFKIARSRR